MVAMTIWLFKYYYFNISSLCLESSGKYLSSRPLVCLHFITINIAYLITCYQRDFQFGVFFSLPPLSRGKFNQHLRLLLKSYHIGDVLKDVISNVRKISAYLPL